MESGGAKDSGIGGRGLGRSLRLAGGRRAAPAPPAPWIASAAPGRGCAPKVCARWWMRPAWRWSACWKWWVTCRASGASTGNWSPPRGRNSRTWPSSPIHPIFTCRVARRLAAQGVPVVYLVAPQAWAWRKGRVKTLRRTVTRLLCIFPFEEEFFRAAGVKTTYIGHPLAGLVKPSLSREEFFRKHGLDPARPLIAVLPGSRRGEAARHLPALMEAVRILHRERAISFVLPASATTGAGFFESRVGDCAGAGDRGGKLGCHGALYAGAGRQRNRDGGGRVVGRPDGDVLQGNRARVGCWGS